MLGHQLHQHLADQARFARSGDAGDGGEDAQRKSDVELVEVIARDAARRSQPLGWRGVRVGSG